MGKIFFILFILFTVSSCTYENADCQRVSKKDFMESWAYKIFIFTDEGEELPVPSHLKNFNDITKGRTIFADDIWKKNLKHNLVVKTDEGNDKIKSR